ncbi:MAG: hypothetical protein AAGK32_18010 [Actinomycetota bacterium]
MALPPPLDGTYPLAASSRDAFARDGHVLVEGLASPAEPGGPVDGPKKPVQWP